VSARQVPRRFAVAFSLAGEQRLLVLAVAQEVEAILGQSTVFYDDWYTHWLAGSDTDLLLQSVYGERAELVVVCVSGAYGDKPWTHTEHQAVRARLQQPATAEDRLRVLPVRVGDGEVQGILFNEIVPDIRDKTPVQAAELIVSRLNLVRASAADSKSTLARWPSDIPVPQWPMAGNGEAPNIFASLLRDATSERALLVQGESETGKSYMAEQMLRNAMLLPGVVAGRFDFKSKTNIDVEIEAFSRLLGIEPPTGHTLNERLAKIFRELQVQAKPTLLVFDTYEAAGEAKDWIENVLLPHLLTARWLRVIIVGQSVPTSAGSTWESVAASTLTLQLPGLDDWLAYGRVNRGETLSPGVVMQAYDHADGKPTVLADLLGPHRADHKPTFPRHDTPRGLDEPDVSGPHFSDNILPERTPTSVAGQIFVSYRRDDTAYPSGWLFDKLTQHFGKNQIFKDIDSIRLGDDFADVITAAVERCEVLLALIGQRWLTCTDKDGRRCLDNPNDFVRLEIEAAIVRNVRIIPILVEGASMPHADELPPSLAKLARRQALELSPSRFDFDTSRLLRVLDTTIFQAGDPH